MCKPDSLDNDCSIPAYFSIDQCNNDIEQVGCLKALALVFLLLAGQFICLPSAQALSLQAAEQLVRQNDFSSKALQSKSDALSESAGADRQLADPQLTLGLFNIPIDNFNVNSQPNMQLRFGIAQSFPRGKTLVFKQKQAQWASNTQHRLALDQLAKSIQAVRQHYFNLYYQIEAQSVIERSRFYFTQLVDIAESFYKVGRVNQQDLLSAQLELSRLDSRVIELKTQEDLARAALSKWLDDKAFEPIDRQYPDLPALVPQQQIIGALIFHPVIQAEDARVAFFDEGIAIARQQYKPGWSIGVEYRTRFGNNPDGSRRSDQAAAMVKVDLPFFTDQRQDRRLAASRHQYTAARHMRSDKLRDLRQAVFKNYTNWLRLTEHSALYRQRLAPEADANAQASLKAYQSGVAEFTSLARARITQLNVRLEALHTKIQRSIVHARLLYLAQGVSK